MRAALVLLIIFSVSGCIAPVSDSDQSEVKKYYENKRLGIAFEYPSNFNLDEDDRLNRIFIEDNSIIENISLIQIQKAGEEKLTEEELKNSVENSFARIINRRRFGNYELIELERIEIESGYTYYLINSERGLFFISGIDHLKDKLTEGQYVTVKKQFDEIKNSIRII